jgi:hypothetical protein
MTRLNSYFTYVNPFHLVKQIFQWLLRREIDQEENIFEPCTNLCLKYGPKWPKYKQPECRIH